MSAKRKFWTRTGSIFKSVGKAVGGAVSTIVPKPFGAIGAAITAVSSIGDNKIVQPSSVPAPKILESYSRIDEDGRQGVNNTQMNLRSTTNSPSTSNFIQDKVLPFLKKWYYLPVIVPVGSVVAYYFFRKPTKRRGGRR